jgi:hypothetical protein
MSLRVEQRCYIQVILMRITKRNYATRRRHAINDH